MKNMSEADLYDKLNDILSEYDKRGLSCEEAITMIKECAPYLITYKEKYESYTHYRVDKMEQIEITDEEYERLKNAKW